MREILSNLNQIRSKIGGKALLVAVSKGQPASSIEEAVRGGQLDFGENYAQEFLEHYAAVGARSPRPGGETPPLQNIAWHFIGHLQTNKIKQIIEKTTLIHTVDSEKLAGEVDKQASKIGKVQKILIEVNLGGEGSKSGISKERLFPLVDSCKKLASIELCGLMAIPPFFENLEEVRPYFRELRKIRDVINHEKIYKQPLVELSIGMTHDYEVALQEGATIVRIGTGIFGERRK